MTGPGCRQLPSLSGPSPAYFPAHHLLYPGRAAVLTLLRSYDTSHNDPKPARPSLQSPTSRRNMLGRFVVTTIYCSLLTLLGCALPFFGSFLALVRAFSCPAMGWHRLNVLSRT